MAAKKPLLPPGSRWNTLEKCSERNKEKEQPKNNGSEVSNEVTPKLCTSVSTGEITSLCEESNFHRKPQRSNSDDVLSHDKGIPRKPLPPPPPLNRKVDGTNVGSSIAQRSSPYFEKPPPPPYKARNSPESPNKSPKPPIIPRKIRTRTDEVDSMDKRPKPPIPRKPRTVYASGRTGPVLHRKPNVGGSVRIEPSGLLQKADVCRPPPNPNKDIQFRVKIPINEANKSKPSLEKMLLSKSVDTGAGVGVKDIPSPVGNERPASMILTSQVVCYC